MRNAYTKINGIIQFTLLIFRFELKKVDVFEDSTNIITYLINKYINGGYKQNGYVRFSSFQRMCACADII